MMLYEKIYDNAMNGTDELYRLLSTDSKWIIKSKNLFIFISFNYHLFFYRIVLLSKYSDNYVKELLFKCIDKYISHLSINTIQEKNKVIDASNEIFEALGSFIVSLSETHDPYIMNFLGQYLIGYVEMCKPAEVFDFKTTMLITSYFTELLKNCDFLVANEEEEKINENFPLKLVIAVCVIFAIIIFLKFLQ